MKRSNPIKKTAEIPFFKKMMIHGEIRPNPDGIVQKPTEDFSRLESRPIEDICLY